MIEGTDLFVGLSGPGIISASDLEKMNPDPFVFAMANPNPEVQPEEAAPARARDGHRTLRLPQPDQQRARLPGRVPWRARRARDRDHRGDEAGCGAGHRQHVLDDELDEDYIIPSVFNRDVAREVASAVRDEAERSGGDARRGESRP